jgi:predicted solute-binding protein
MEWWLWQHVPFVFAVWVVRQAVEDAVAKRIEAAVARALAVNAADLSGIAQHYAKPYGMSAEKIEYYLQAFIYRLGKEEEMGIQGYEQLLQKHNLLHWEPVEALPTPTA